MAVRSRNQAASLARGDDMAADSPAKPTSQPTWSSFALTALRQFRLVALLEGSSFLALLFIAMPLKYLAGLPLAVRIVGACMVCSF